MAKEETALEHANSMGYPTWDGTGEVRDLFYSPNPIYSGQCFVIIGQHQDYYVLDESHYPGEFYNDYK